MYLPNEMTQAPKVPQTIPLDGWLRGAMKDYVRSHLTKEDLDQEGSFNTGVILRQLDEHIEGRANHKWVLWTCLTYLIWRDRVLGV
jgi:asparagine synthase (glutamine-hydrolysing)